AKGYSEMTGTPITISCWGEFDKVDACIEAASKGKRHKSWSYESHKPVKARVIAKHIRGQDIEGELREKLEEFIRAIKKGA
ncbi:unnamed protein product, partial [marine sediment metagenome]